MGRKKLASKTLQNGLLVVAEVYFDGVPQLWLGKRLIAFRNVARLMRAFNRVN